MKLLVLAVCLAVAAASVLPLKPIRKHMIPDQMQKLTGLELIDYVNHVQSFYKTSLSPRFAQYPDDIKKRLMGVRKIEIPAEDRLNEVRHDNIADDAIPDSFDSRTQWPDCTSISHVRDQSSCGSCWAFGAAEAISDRLCIASQGAIKVNISSDDILSCCGLACGFGCEGGYPIQAWKHWVNQGYVTGSDYQDHAGCKPYPFPECEHHMNASHYQPCPSDIYPTDKCTQQCQSSYNKAYKDDKFYGKTAYAVSRKPADIQKEIMTNGPVEVSYTVYEDFEHYTGGIYVHTAGQELGGHAVKMLGWGVENGTPYWICANSWNSDWGENGFFRIIRGVDECGIESGVVGGLPKL